MPVDAVPRLGAILLAGGRGSRMGGVRKPDLTLGGQSLLAAGIAATRDAGCRPITVVGPYRADLAEPVIVTQEHPPHGGPVAGIAAALDTWTPLADASAGPELALVLAADLARPDLVVARLTAALSTVSVVDGIRLLDATGIAQPLCAVYRTSALRRRLQTLPGGQRDASMRALLAGLEIADIPAHEIDSADITTGADITGGIDITADIDTWEDLENARRSTS